MRMMRQIIIVATATVIASLITLNFIPMEYEGIRCAFWGLALATGILDLIAIFFLKNPSWPPPQG